MNVETMATVLDFLGRSPQCRVDVDVDCCGCCSSSPSPSTLDVGVRHPPFSLQVQRSLVYVLGLLPFFARASSSSSPCYQRAPPPSCFFSYVFVFFPFRIFQYHFHD